MCPLWRELPDGIESDPRELPDRIESDPRAEARAEMETDAPLLPGQKNKYPL